MGREPRRLAAESSENGGINVTQGGGKGCSGSTRGGTSVAAGSSSGMLTIAPSFLRWVLAFFLRCRLFFLVLLRRMLSVSARERVSDVCLEQCFK